MPRVKIKQLDTRISTSGIHMGGGPERRKLHPGEIVDIPEDFEAGQHGGKSLFEALWATGKLELALEPATRPLDFADEREAQVTSPTFKTRGPHEELEVEQAWDAIESRMASKSAQPVADSPADEVPDTTVDSAPDVDPPDGAKNRRAQRRAALRAAKHEQEVTA